MWLYHSILLLALASAGCSALFADFHLYTSAGQGEAERVTSRNIASSSFDASRPTKIIIHGFGDSVARGEWMRQLKDLFLEREAANVILADVSRANPPVYAVAVTNARVVAREVASLIKASGVAPSNVHIVGQSLGAQTAGLVGKKFSGDQIGHITGLDPAGPMFQGRSTRSKLWRSDAQFVDIVHTDMAHVGVMPLGTSEACGHADFYINGGKYQPGCVGKRLTGDFRERIACDHIRSIQYYLASFNRSEPVPRAFECSSWEKFQAGECYECGQAGDKCALVGPGAQEWAQKQAGNKKFYISTIGEAPYYRYQYVVAVTPSQSASGRIDVQVGGQNVEFESR